MPKVFKNMQLQLFDRAEVMKGTLNVTESAKKSFQLHVFGNPYLDLRVCITLKFGHYIHIYP